MFAKAWKPGLVKTRLGRTIGLQRSADLYKLFIEFLAHRLANSLSDVDRVIAFSPPSCQSYFDSFDSLGWKIAPQSEGDLGQRISEFFRWGLTEERYDQVVLIGSDSPDLDIGIINKAFFQLEKTDAVFSPSDDGGYCLVGLSHWDANYFVDIPWSTPEVFETSLRRVDQAAGSVATLPSWYDVDTLEDLDRLIQTLENSSDDPSSVDFATQLRRVLNAR